MEENFIETIRKNIPVLYQERVKKYIAELQVSAYDAAVITEEKNFADFFENTISYTNNHKAAANWMLGPVKSWLNDKNKDITDFPLQPAQIAALISLVDDGKLSFFAASTKILLQLLADPSGDPEKIAIAQNLMQQSDVSDIGPLIDKVLEKFADKVTEYKKGKKGLLALFVGEVMKQSKGKADPKVTSKLLTEKLK